MKPAKAKWGIIVITLLVVVLAYAGSSYATFYCMDLDGRPITVGEARYHVLSDDDECYANAYWDGADELSEPNGDVIGGAANAMETDLNFRATAYLYDTAGDDCANATIQMVQKRSNTSSADCPSAYTSITDTFYINSCDGVDVDFFYAPGRVGRGGMQYRRYWQWDLTVSTGTGCSDSDSGCGAIWNENECTLCDENWNCP
jgi:hypothetical protein